MEQPPAVPGLNGKVDLGDDPFRTMWEMSPNAMALSDRAGVVLLANPAYLELCGYAAEEVIGQNFAVIYPEEARAAANEQHQEMFEHGDPTAWFESLVRRKDGSERVVEVRIAFIADDRARRTGMVNAIRDITTRNRAEEAAAQARQEGRRIFDMEHAARGEAERALRERDEFLATVSHDLQNLLAATGGSAQLLLRRVQQVDSDPALALVELAASIDATAGQMSAQVEELMDIAREEAGRSVTLNREPVDLESLAQEVLASYRESLSLHPIAFRCDAPAPVGEWDRVRVHRVLANLLLNAAKYSPPGAEIALELARAAGSNGPIATITVRDHGAGIAASELPRIFDRFYRSTSATGSVSGNGLGLASVRQIVELHGGSIEVQSEEGVGSAFTVRLPL